MNARWYAKVRRYGNNTATSVIGTRDDLAAANEIAADWNHRYQTDAAYVEAYDPAKAWPA